MTREPVAETSEDAALAAALERTRRDYDATPYPSLPLAYADPARMAANARFLGLAPPAAASARVLEIGCASGGHLVPLAARLPRARFLGVDLSPVQIADGQARIARLGLGNITLAARSFVELGRNDGPFDYIICHGVYSWIPDPLRDDLLNACKRLLSENGVAMISYNVLPGWRLFQIARDCMRLHAGGESDPGARGQKARRLFGLLAELSSDRGSYGRFWRDEARHMASRGDSYLAHEVFEESNAPSTFRDFTARAARSGLAYLAEASLGANNAASLADGSDAAIAELSGGDFLAREQYIDMFSGRSFRQSLLVHAERSSDVERAMPEERIGEFHLIAPLELKVTAVADEPGRWIIGEGGGGVASHEADVVAAIGRLIARLPSSSRLDDIAPEGAGDAPRRAIAATLVRMLKFGHLDVSVERIACAVGLPARPVAWSLAASDARHGDATATLRHAPFRMEPLQRFLLHGLDGAHTRDDLVALLVDEGLRGALKIAGPDGPVEGRERLAASLGPAVDQCLATFARVGLLVAA